MAKHVPPPRGEPLDSSGLEAALGQQEAATLLSDLPRLRKQASEQIEFLIALLDATEDTDTDTQCDDDPVDDLEEEPSLCGVTVAAKNMPKDQFGNDTEGDAHEDDEDGHDSEGDELYHGGESAHENDEPSLGWTDEEAATGRRYAGTMGSSADLEVGTPATAPQNRTRINRKPLTVEVTYRRFLRGLAPKQRAAMQERMLGDSGVSLVGGPAWGEKSEV
jgi:hypothetical protein